MIAIPRSPLLSWTNVVPLLAVALLALTWGLEPGAVLVSAVAVVLAVAVTVIEVALIVTLMVSGGPEAASLARDTVFAAVMITTNGMAVAPR